MNVRAPLVLIASLAVGPQAQGTLSALSAGDAGKFDSAVSAGRATIVALAGRTPVVRVTTIGCVTHIKTARDAFEIDWTSSTVNAALTRGATLMISEGPTQDFAIDFGVRAQVPVARALAERLSATCAR